MSSRADRRRRLTGGLLLGCAAVAAAISAAASASAPALEPRALLQAKAIQVQVNARYRRLAGRKLRVTEATSFGAIKSISIIEDVFEPARVVPADNGIYFQIRSLQTRRPHRERSAAWTDDAFRPRRLAVELAARTFARTTASLAVVSLPTRFTWVVFERAAFRTCEKKNQV